MVEEITQGEVHRHHYQVGKYEERLSESLHQDTGKHKDLRKKIEPWLSAVFQSEHLSLLLGSGFTTAVASGNAVDMGIGEAEHDDAETIQRAAELSAQRTDRGSANLEDYIRIANELLRGYEILEDEKATSLREHINERMSLFLKDLLETENRILRDLLVEEKDAADHLVSFLLSFASRATSRERLNLFTTNYDRLVECGSDLAGLRVVDRFVGALNPIFRTSRLDIDLHYNPPGIRGEPRYVEGVIRLFKLHGSLDWRLTADFKGKKRIIRRYPIPFGALRHPDMPQSPLDSVMIYPNAAKDTETLMFPYAELFRDFAAVICRPNSALVTYGYGFGDDHINRIIRDMLTIPSTHLVIISYDDDDGRIERFRAKAGRTVQISLLIGSHFGHLPVLVEKYLPKPAIDVIPIRAKNLLERREYDPVGEGYVGLTEAENMDPEIQDPSGEPHANAD